MIFLAIKTTCRKWWWLPCIVAIATVSVSTAPADFKWLLTAIVGAVAAVAVGIVSVPLELHRLRVSASPASTDSHRRG